MPKAPAAITSPKIKKLAAKAVKSPSMLTTVEIREFGASVLAFVSPTVQGSSAPAKKTPAKKAPAKKTPAKKTPAKKVPVKKAQSKTAGATKAVTKKAVAEEVVA